MPEIQEHLKDSERPIDLHHPASQRGKDREYLEIVDRPVAAGWATRRGPRPATLDQIGYVDQANEGHQRIGVRFP